MHIVNGWLSNIQIFIPFSSNELSWYKFKIILMQVKCQCEQYVFISMFLFEYIFTLLTLYLDGFDYGFFGSRAIKYWNCELSYSTSILSQFCLNYQSQGDFRFYLFEFCINCSLYVFVAYQRLEQFKRLKTLKVLLSIKLELNLNLV